jgi:hypothetical protein
MLVTSRAILFLKKYYFFTEISMIANFFNQMERMKKITWSLSLFLGTKLFSQSLNFFNKLKKNNFLLGDQIFF